jgi:membrane-associated phospholipid phosphatase
MNTPSILLWRLPAIALLALLAISDPASNQMWFQSLNQAASRLPATLWSVMTVLGDTLVAFVLLLALLRRYPQLVLAALLASLPATLISHGLKEALEMARPFAVLGEQINVIGPYLKSNSFPSGHTTTVFVLAAVLSLGMRSPVTRVWLLLAAVLVGFSRVAVGAHWPLDIFGGMLCGWISGLLGWHWAERTGWWRNPGVVLFMRVLLIGCALSLLFNSDRYYPLARPFEQAIALLVLVMHVLPDWRKEHLQTA